MSIDEFYEILFGNDKENPYQPDYDFQEIKDDHESMIQRNIYRDPYFLCLKEKISLKSIYKASKGFEDRYPLLTLRRYLSFTFK